MFATTYVYFHVFDQMAFLYKGFVAMRTAMRPDSAMAFGMEFPFLFGCKCPTTFVARKWFFVAMNAIVMDQISLVHQFFAAEMTKPFGFRVHFHVDV